MQVLQLFFIACVQCNRQFGGPHAGEYNIGDYGGVEELTSYLVSEAIDLGWLRIWWHNADVLVCSPGCAADWMNEYIQQMN